MHAHLLVADDHLELGGMSLGCTDEHVLDLDRDLVYLMQTRRMFFEELVRRRDWAKAGVLER